MKHAVIITENQYPCEDAGAIRQHATAKILKMLGYSVLVLGYGKSTGGKVLTYDDVEYISFRPKMRNKWIRVAYRVTASIRMMRFFRKNCRETSLILVADVYTPTVKQVASYAIRKKITLIHDSVEWFSPQQFRNGTHAFAYWDRNTINRKLISRDWRVMAISSYLEEHFKKQCDKVVRIPVIMDTDTIAYRTDVKSGEKITFAYVGSPGKKDYLGEMISGFALLSPEQRSALEFHVVGVTKEQLETVCGADHQALEALGDTLIAHGRLPHEEAIAFVRNADFTLLFRDNTLRYAKAGFPTKIVESLSCGTPPICNLSSDLDLYLKDGENAFVANGFAPEDIKEVLEKVLVVSVEERKKMRIAARKTAEEQFDYTKYVDKMKDLTDI